MKNGNWIPICKNLLKYLPKDRAYTKMEAAYSLQSDYDNKNTVTISGYSALWRWSKGKVYRFLEEMDVKIKYPKDTKKFKNQNGLIIEPKRVLKQTNNGLIRFIDSKWLGEQTDLKQTKDGLKTDLSQVTTQHPNPNPKYKYKQKVPIPKDIFLTDDFIKYAKSKKINGVLDDIFEGFCIYHRKKGSKFQDWYAAWQTWTRNHIKFNPQQTSNLPTAEEVVAGYENNG